MTSAYQAPRWYRVDGSSHCGVIQRRPRQALDQQGRSTPINFIPGEDWAQTVRTALVILASAARRSVQQVAEHVSRPIVRQQRSAEERRAVLLRDKTRKPGKPPTTDGECSFKRSREPQFAEKLVDIVDLYLDPLPMRWCYRAELVPRRRDSCPGVLAGRIIAAASLLLSSGPWSPGGCACPSRYARLPFDGEPKHFRLTDDPNTLTLRGLNAALRASSILRNDDKPHDAVRRFSRRRTGTAQPVSKDRGRGGEACFATFVRVLKYSKQSIGVRRCRAARAEWRTRPPRIRSATTSERTSGLGCAIRAGACATTQAAEAVGLRHRWAAGSARRRSCRSAATGQRTS